MIDDIIFSPEFTDYRRLEVEAAAKIVRQFINGTVSSDTFVGAMKMFKAIVNIPNDIAKTEEAKTRAKELRDKMLSEFEASLIRRYLREEA